MTERVSEEEIADLLRHYEAPWVEKIVTRLLAERRELEARLAEARREAFQEVRERMATARKNAYEGPDLRAIAEFSNWLRAQATPPASEKGSE